MNRTKRTWTITSGLIALAAALLPLTAGAAAETGAQGDHRPAATPQTEPAAGSVAHRETGSVEEVTRHPDGMLSLVVGPQHDAALHSGVQSPHGDAPATPRLQCSETAATPADSGASSEPAARAEKE